MASAESALNAYKKSSHALRNSPEGLWFRKACPPVFQLLRVGCAEAAIAYLSCYNQQKSYLRYRKGIRLPIVCPFHGESLVTLAWKHTEGKRRDKIISKLIRNHLIYNVDTFSGVDIGIKRMIVRTIVPMKLWSSERELQSDIAFIERGDAKALSHSSIQREKALQVGFGLCGVLSVERAAAWIQDSLYTHTDVRFCYYGLAPRAAVLGHSVISDRALCDKAVASLCEKITQSSTMSYKSASIMSNVVLVRHVSSLRESLRYGAFYEGDLIVKKKLSRILRTYCFSCKKGLSGQGLCKRCGRSWCRTEACRRYHKKYEKHLIQRIQKKPLHICASCGRARGRFRCTGCNSRTWYCNRLCQKQHWKVHETACWTTRRIKAQQCSWPGCPSHRPGEQNCDRGVNACFYEKCKGRSVVAHCKRERCRKYSSRVLAEHGLRYHKGLDSFSATVLQGLLPYVLLLKFESSEDTTGSFLERAKAGLLASFDCLRDKPHSLPCAPEDFVEGISMTYEQRQEQLSKLIRAACL